MALSHGIIGYEQITSLSSAASLTVPATATMAIFTAEDNHVRWRADGTSPTADVGQLIKTTDPPFTIHGQADLQAFEAFESASSATLNVTYYGRQS